MPIYEYRCSNCSHELEALQKITDPLLTACPDCHQDTLVKLVSAAGFHLKGSGWYATDFRNGSKPATKTETKGESATADAKPDAKPDAKTDGKSSESTPSTAAPATGCGGGCSCH